MSLQSLLLAKPLIVQTEVKLKKDSWPVWVSDGLDAYGEALKDRHCILETYPRTGKRGRPRRPKLVACPFLRYDERVKERNERHRVVGVFKRSVYGDVPLETISTVYVERHNLNLRHENRRLTRKTIAFSKKIDGLKAKDVSYIRLISTLFVLIVDWRIVFLLIRKGVRTWQPRTPAVAAGLTDHIWSLKELMSFRYYHDITGS